MAIDLEKYRLKAPAAGDAVKIDLEKYRIKNADTYKFPVKITPEDRAQKITRYQNEAAQSQAESKKANSASGFLGNFGKAFVSNIASSEVALGQTIGGIINTNKFADVASDVNQRNTGTKAELLKRIREKRARSEDTSRLERAYNDLTGSVQETSKTFGEIMAPAQKSTGRVLGELGGTALDLLTAGTYGKATQGAKTGQLLRNTNKLRGAATAASPELGAVVDMARRSTGAGTLAGLRRIGTGAGIGYASDVTMGLGGFRGEDRTGGKAFIPGLGTLIGGGTPALSEGTQTAKNTLGKIRDRGSVENIISKRESEIANIENNYAKTRKANDYSKDAGTASRSRVASTDVLVGAVDENGLIRTKQSGGAVEKYRAQTIDGAENVVRNGLEKEGATVNLTAVEARLKKSVRESGLQGKNLINALSDIDKEIAGYKLSANKNGDVPLTLIHDAKIDTTKSINYQTPPEVQASRKAIANGLKTVVEDTSGLNIREINGELGKYLEDIRLLENLDGKRVKGGKLGKYFSQIIGGFAGNTVGGAIGGPIGSTFGTVVGAEIGSKLKGRSLMGTFGNEVGRMAPESEILKNAINSNNAPRLMLPAPKSGAPRSRIESGRPIPIFPKGSQAEFTGKDIS